MKKHIKKYTLHEYTELLQAFQYYLMNDEARTYTKFEFDQFVKDFEAEKYTIKNIK